MEAAPERQRGQPKAERRDTPRKTEGLARSRRGASAWGGEHHRQRGLPQQPPANREPSARSGRARPSRRSGAVAKRTSRARSAAGGQSPTATARKARNYRRGLGRARQAAAGGRTAEGRATARREQPRSGEKPPIAAGWAMQHRCLCASGFAAAPSVQPSALPSPGGVGSGEGLGRAFREVAPSVGVCTSGARAGAAAPPRG